MKKINRFSVYIITLLLCVIIMIGLNLYIRKNLREKTRDYPQIEKEGVLRIALDYNRSSCFVSGDTMAGFEYELCKALEKHTGLRIELYPETNLSQSLEGLKSRQFDIVASAIPITLEYKEEFNFTEPILTNRLVLVQRKAESNHQIQPIRNLLELAHKDIYLPAHSASTQRLNNLAEEIADTIYLHEDDVYGEEQLIIRVACGEIDYAICDESIARTMKKNYPQLDILTAVSFNQFKGWALRKESTILLDSLNNWLHTELNSPNFIRKKRIYHP